MPAVGLVGSSFFPVQDISEFNIVVETPPGSSLDYTRLKVAEVVRIARSYDEVDYTYATVGATSSSVDEATVYVRLKPRAERDRLQAAIESDIRADLASVSGAVASWPSRARTAPQPA